MTLTLQQPWICPVCNRGVAPGVTSCDHGGAPASPAKTFPALPSEPSIPVVPSAPHPAWPGPGPWWDPYHPWQITSGGTPNQGPDLAHYTVSIQRSTGVTPLHLRSIGGDNLVVLQERCIRLGIRTDIGSHRAH